MLLFAENSRGEGFDGVVIVDGDDGLQDDGACVEVFVDEMDCAAGEFGAVFEGLALRFEAGERGKQRWVDIQDAIWECGDEVWGEQAHVACQAD